MSMDQYSKITATLSAVFQGKTCPVLILTSSNEKVEFYEQALLLCQSFKEIGKNTVLVDARLGNATAAEQSVVGLDKEVSVITLNSSDKKQNVINIEYATAMFEKLQENYSMIIVCCNTLNESYSSHYFTAKSDGVVLVEQKKCSRTDHIDEIITTIKNLKATPLGFIYKK